MIVAIHQPNFCPWLGYFAKIARCDVFIFLDDVQYSKNGWTNRVRIKTPQGPAWLTVPTVRPSGSRTRVNEALTNDKAGWQEKISKTLEANYARAPFFEEMIALIAPELSGARDSLADLNIRLIERIAGSTKMSAAWTRSSDLGSNGTGTDRLVSLVGCVGGLVYLSGDGASGYQEDAKFLEASIQLEANHFEHPGYPQLWGEFVPGLSILDTLANLGVDGTTELLDQFCRRTELAHATH